MMIFLIWADGSLILSQMIGNNYASLLYLNDLISCLIACKRTFYFISSDLCFNTTLRCLTYSFIKLGGLEIQNIGKKCLNYRRAFALFDDSLFEVS